MLIETPIAQRNTGFPLLSGVSTNRVRLRTLNGEYHGVHAPQTDVAGSAEAK